MQHPIRNFLILILSIVSIMLFANVAIAAGAVEPTPADPALAPPTPAPTPIPDPGITPNMTQEAPPAVDNALPQVHRPARVVTTEPPIAKENITVTSARAKPSLAGSNNSAVYISIHNANKGPLTILGATALTSEKPTASSIANRVELHTVTTDNNGITKMIPVNRLVVPAEGELIMESGGVHIMLLDLKQALKENDAIYVNLIIQNIGTYMVPVSVKMLDY